MLVLFLLGNVFIKNHALFFVKRGGQTLITTGKIDSCARCLLKLTGKAMDGQESVVSSKTFTQAR